MTTLGLWAEAHLGPDSCYEDFTALRSSSVSDVAQAPIHLGLAVPLCGECLASLVTMFMRGLAARMSLQGRGL